MSYKSEIQKMINTAPSSWKKMFRRYKLGTKPTVNKLIETVLEYTPSMQKYGSKGEAKFTPPKSVRKEAMKGLRLSHRENYTSASGIGLVRAMQLAVKPKVWERTIKRMSAYFTRHDKDQNSRNFGNDDDPSRGYMAWLNWGGDSGRDWADSKVNSRSVSANPKDGKGRNIPARYLKGLSGAKRKKRIKEIEERRDEYDAMEKSGKKPTKKELEKLFRDFETDKGAKKKPSGYTLEAQERGFTGSNAQKAKSASKYYGGKIPVKILEKVYSKGIAAWASGGHRPGASKWNWGAARVNSFLVGGKTFFTADKKLADQLPAKVRNAIEAERVYKDNPWDKYQTFEGSNPDRVIYSVALGKARRGKSVENIARYLRRMAKSVGIYMSYMDSINRARDIVHSIEGR